jgi:hypothetical protein
MAKFKQLAGMPQNTEDMDNNETFKIVLTPES